MEGEGFACSPPAHGVLIEITISLLLPGWELPWLSNASGPSKVGQFFHNTLIFSIQHRRLLAPEAGFVITRDQQSGSFKEIRFFSRLWLYPFIRGRRPRGREGPGERKMVFWRRADLSGKCSPGGEGQCTGDLHFSTEWLRFRKSDGHTRLSAVGPGFASGLHSPTWQIGSFGLRIGEARQLRLAETRTRR
jgi:hypothetical protein